MTDFQKGLTELKTVKFSDSMWDAGLWEPGIFEEQNSGIFQKVLTELKKK